jgi:PAS domain S-box-containing protein
MEETDVRISKLENEVASLNDEIAYLKQKNADKDSLQAAYMAGQQRFKTLFEKSSLGKKIIDSNLFIVQANNSLSLMLGFNAVEIIGKPIINFAHPDFVDHWQKLQHQLWSKQSLSFSMETCLIRKDETAFWCEVNSIIFEDNGERFGYTILEDIGERKELERVKEEMNQQLHIARQLQHERDNQRLMLEITIITQEEERRRIAESCTMV